jgi:hypothetical protein
MGMRTTLGGLTIALTLALAACSPASGAPTSSPTPASPTPAPTETPGAEPGPPAVIVLSGSDLEVRDADGTMLAHHDFGDGPEAIAATITAASGIDPDIHTYETDDECSVAGTSRYWWATADGGGLVMNTPWSGAEAPWDTVDFGLRVRTLGDVEIVTSAGFSWGDDVTAFAAALPADERDDDNAFIWDRTTTYEGQAFGGAASTTETGVVAFIGTPGLMHSWYC